ncbi:probable RNA-binding protein CG14230 isoform X2 [Anoplophora glabripennis]|uniref:probable RNA-binding protein CG14230 isoform X2 n=1 Tax=Anoplophora glabripennis TaxID=217634 RepID=UPI000874878D|nr:probable RNA-binding protein CG14230 isoform X2 [Anoplophora glabripennis]
MKLENKRIFISNLPETVTPDELKNCAKNYGNVTSVEIKERKELGLKNDSLFFAYINVEIDDRSLQQYFANGKCMGQRIVLQVARESFLDRLKREREEKGDPQKVINVLNSSGAQQSTIKLNQTSSSKIEEKKKHTSKKIKREQSESSSTEDEKKVPKRSKNDVISKLNNEEEISHDTDEIVGFVIKNNKGKTVDKNGLKIESVGKSPILRIDKLKRKPEINSSEANLKRLQSLSNLKKSYKSQKSLIQQSLSKIDNVPNKKIIFDETENVNTDELNHTGTNSKKSLFDDELQEDDFEPNFEIKEQFQGEKGQKLLELQTRYKNDKRFVLDSRFLDENGDEKEADDHLENKEEVSLEDEKKKEYQILEQILGKKVVPKQKAESGSQRKVMLRFDPTQPEHSKFELKNEAKKEKKRRKRENSETDVLNEKKQEEKEVPEVSKEVFYKVTDDLKDSLKEKHEFSLLSMFGKADEEEQVKEEEETTKQISSGTNKFMQEKNPFRYDSSDDENETEDVPNKEDAQQNEKPLETQARTNARNTFWSEPFFFTDDDYRLQEGVDFIEKMSTKEDNDFTKLRRDLKGIVKAKVRNNQRKNRPFKKKLGGSKKKKMLRIKRALKR